MARKRNNTPLTTEQSKLAAAFIPLMRATAAKFISDGHWHEFTDLVSEGSMILVMAARGYSEDTGWTFEAYVRESLKNGFWGFIKEERAKGREKWDGVQKISPTYISNNVGNSTSNTHISPRKARKRNVGVKPTYTPHEFIDPHTIAALEPSHYEEDRALFRFDLTNELRLLRGEIRKRFLLSQIIAMLGSLLALRNLPYLYEIISEGLVLWEAIENGDRPDLIDHLREVLAPHNEGKESSMTIKEMQALTRKSYQSILWAITHDKISAFKVGSKWKVNTKDARVFAQRLAMGKIVIDKEQQAEKVSSESEDNGQPSLEVDGGNVSSSEVA